MQGWLRTLLSAFHQRGCLGHTYHGTPSTTPKNTSQKPLTNDHAQPRARYLAFPLSMRVAIIRPRATTRGKKQALQNTSQRGIEGSNPSSSASQHASAFGLRLSATLRPSASLSAFLVPASLCCARGAAAHGGRVRRSRRRPETTSLRKRRVCRMNAKAKKGAGGEPGPYYTNGASVTGYLYPWPRHLVIALSIQRGLVQPKSVALSACSHAGCWIWTSENGPYSIT